MQIQWQHQGADGGEVVGDVAGYLGMAERLWQWEGTVGRLVSR